MAEINTNPDINIDQEGGSGGTGTSETSNYIFYQNIKPTITNFYITNLDIFFTEHNIPLKVHENSSSYTVEYDSITQSLEIKGTSLWFVSKNVVYLKYLKFKNNKDEFVYYSADSEGRFFILSSENQSATIGVADIGLAMLKTDCYLWDNKNILKDSKTSFVAKTEKLDLWEVPSIEEEAKKGVYKTIPFYYIVNTYSNQESIKGFSYFSGMRIPSPKFGYNFKDALVYDNDWTSKNAEYWGFVASTMYPRKIVLDTLTSFDATQNYEIYNSLNKHTITYKNSILNIDGKKYEINPKTDKVIFYKRSVGNWKLEKEIEPNFIPEYWKEENTIGSTSADIMVAETTGSYNSEGSLMCKDIKTYELDLSKENVTFGMPDNPPTSFLETNWNTFFESQLSETTEDKYKEIIVTRDDFTIDLPEISGANYAHYPYFYQGGQNFISFGKYDYVIDSYQGVIIQNNKPLEKLTLNTKATIKNFQYIENTTNSFKIIDSNMNGSKAIIGENNIVSDWKNISASFSKQIHSFLGTFPNYLNTIKKIGNMPYYEKEYERYEGWTYIDKYIFKENQFDSNISRRINSLTLTREGDYIDNKTFTISPFGYYKTFDNTFGLAIVIWSAKLQ